MVASNYWRRFAMRLEVVVTLRKGEVYMALFITGMAVTVKVATLRVRRSAELSLVVTLGECV